MKIIYVLVLVAFFSVINNNSTVYAQIEDSKTQKLPGIDKLLTAEEQEVFKKADKIEILLIDENSGDSVDFRKEEFQKLNEKDKFHGYKVLKTASVSKVEFKNQITESLFDSIGNGQTKRCFVPHHGVRATYENKTIELVICFHCSHIYAFNGTGYKFSSISEDAKDYFNILIENFKE